jgi:hypothetical protein
MGSFQLGRGEQLQCWRNVALLRDLAIHGRLCLSFEGSTATDYAGSCAVAQRVDAFDEKKQWFEPHRMGSLWFVACWSLSVSSLLLLSGQLCIIILCNNSGASLYGHQGSCKGAGQLRLYKNGVFKRLCDRNVHFMAKKHAQSHKPLQNKKIAFTQPLCNYCAVYAQV